MSNNFESYAREYAEAAGLKPTDMPSPHHPLLESDDDINSLGDLIDARDGSSTAPGEPRGMQIDDPDLEDDASYMTRADFEQEMNLSDPDPNAGADRADYLGDAGIDRAPDLTGTVVGIARGMSTHLPQDLGADGFQILEPEDLERSLIDDDEEEMLDGIDLSDPFATGGVLPVHAEIAASRDDALDGTRRLT